MAAASLPAGPTLLHASFLEKIWGSTHVEPWFPSTDRKIGEVWFQAEPPLPLLVKFLFTSDRLSVQAHPDDEYAARFENSRGKTEMWYILRADPGAQLAIGLREAISPERLREASLSGEIEHMLNWVDVTPGQAVFIPAGTIHAIGGGLALCEIQEHSDITYRLYDYGRPRELHLDKAMEVSDLKPYSVAAPPAGYLAWCSHFATEELQLQGETSYQPDPERFHLLIVIEGEGMMGSRRYYPGQVWRVPAASPPFVIAADGPTKLLRTFVP